MERSHQHFSPNLFHLRTGIADFLATGDGTIIPTADNPANIERLRGEGFHTICFGNSSNKSVAAPRAESWGEVYRLVHEHADALSS